MTKIFEALQEASRKRDQDAPAMRLARTELAQPDVPAPAAPVKTPPAPVAPSKPAGVDVDREREESLALLYQNVVSLLPGVERPCLLFMSSTTGEGCTTVTREFGYMAAKRMNKKVLVLDADRPSSGASANQPAGSLGRSPGIEEALAGGNGPQEAIRPLTDFNLFEARLTTQPAMPSLLADGERMEGLILELKESHDLVLIDAPSAQASSDGFFLSRLADGVVLVLEAEKTRWQVANRVKERIAASGGNILGVVLNKRRFHIPERIYKNI